MKAMLFSLFFLLIFGFGFAQNTTSSGLAYEILKASVGPKPQKGDEVKVKLMGILEDGTIFQDEAKTSLIVGQPGFLPGFLEAIEILKEGEKGRFVLPPHLGYGAKGAMDDFEPNTYLVPPNSTIIFEIELMKIK